MKQKLSKKDRCTFTQIVWKDRENTAPKIKAELNDHLENPVSTKNIRELYKAGFHGGGVAISKPY